MGHDPFPGTDHIGLEVLPTGPYALLERPWDVTPLVAESPLFVVGKVILLKHSTLLGFNITGQVRRLSGRWPTLMHSGAVHFRGFTLDGTMLWRGVADRISPVEFSMRGEYALVTLGLLAPIEVWPAR